MNRYRLVSFRFSRNPASNDLLLMVTGPARYRTLLSRAFPGLYFSQAFPDRFGQYDWGTYIRGADAAQEAGLKELCQLFQHSICIEDDLTECFALSFHTQMSVAGSSERTPLGRMVREAKPYNQASSPGSREKAHELAALLAQFINQHPTYRQGDAVVAVPPSNPNKPVDLPTVLVETVMALTGQVGATAAVRKVRTTLPMKECLTVQEKVDNLKDAFAGEASVFQGKKVILVDDIYETGFSINEVGRALRLAGASLVLGLTATKTARDLPAAPAPPEGTDDVPF